MKMRCERGIRWVSYDRPGYGGSTPHPGRDVASAAADVASVADALGIGGLYRSFDPIGRQVADTGCALAAQL